MSFEQMPHTIACLSRITKSFNDSVVRKISEHTVALNSSLYAFAILLSVIFVIVHWFISILHICQSFSRNDGSEAFLLNSDLSSFRVSEHQCAICMLAVQRTILELDGHNLVFSYGHSGFGDSISFGCTWHTFKVPLDSSL